VRTINIEMFLLCTKMAVNREPGSGWEGGAEIARPGNTEPHRKDGYRETCFSVRVDAHYKFMFAAGSII